MRRGFMIGSVLAVIAMDQSMSEATAQQFETGPYANEEAYVKERYASTTYVNHGKSIGLIRAVELSISDQVAGKCWTNHDAIRARLRVELERSNIAVYVEPLAVPTAFNPVVDLTVVGFRLSNGVCAATATTSVWYRSDVQLGSLGHTGGVISIGGMHTLWTKTSIFTNGGDLNAPLMQQSQEWIDTLIADISEAKRDADVQKASELWPRRPPMTAREFNAQVEKVMKQPQ
ncbi:hypothetical protein [Sinorhizobium fredii]|uniref:hypothetical protein n=1 Tax=Rhizobium fredii TaxID=380 RepID=UPI00339AA00E